MPIHSRILRFIKISILVVTLFFISITVVLAASPSRTDIESQNRKARQEDQERKEREQNQDVFLQKANQDTTILTLPDRILRWWGCQ